MAASPARAHAHGRPCERDAVRQPQPPSSLLASNAEGDTHWGGLVEESHTNPDTQWAVVLQSVLHALPSQE